MKTKMTKLIVLLVIALFQFTDSFGQLTTVLPNDGGTSGNCRAPSNRYSRGRIVYLIKASEMAASGFASGTQVSQIGWTYSTLQGGTATAPLIVYLQNTADATNLKSTTWATAIAPMTIASNSTVTVANTLTPNIIFSGGSTFTYTGGGVYVAFDWGCLSGTLGATAVVSCNSAGLVNGLLSAQLLTACPNTASTTTAASSFRPETRFGPPVTACSGTPNPGNTISTANPACSSTNFTLSLQTNTTGTGVTYQWQLSPSNVTYTNITGATAATLVTNQLVATYYRCAVTCSAGPTTTNSNPLLVGLNSTFSSCICTSPTYSVGTASCANNLYINSFAFAGINNTSGCNSTAPYYQYFSSMTASVTQTSTYAIAFSTPVFTTNFIQYFKAWIDYNDNGSFDDPNEQIYTSGNIGTFVNSSAGNVTIPLTANPGSHRLRIRSMDGDVNSCSGDGVAGEVEDYNITVVAAPVCTGTPAPGLTLASTPLACSTTSINLSMQNAITGLGVTYQWQSSTNGTTYSNITGAISTTATTTQTVATFYRCVCTCSGVDGISTPVKVEFSTPCICTNPVYTFGNGCANALYINNFTFAGINNTSGCYSNPQFTDLYYTYFPSLTATGVRGTNYPLSISTPPANNFFQFFDVYIDYNDNGSFDDAGEKIFTSNSISTSVNTASGTYTIPAAAALGTHKMRVRSYDVATAINSCATDGGAGEVEDYNITIVAVVQCAGTPSAGTAIASATSICGSGTTGLSLSGATTDVGLTYQWQQSTNAGAYSNIAGATASTFTTPSLSGTGTTYQFRCVVTCSNSSQSATSGTTALVTVYALPTISPSSISLCAGSSAVATASPSGGTYFWSNGLGTGQTATITTPGTYTVTVTQAGCVNTATATAATAANPVMTSVTATPSAVCSGGNSVLVASATAPAGSGYCTPSTVNGGTASDEITLFSSAGLGYNYTNAVMTATPGYLDRTTIVGNGVAGTTYSVTVNQQDASDAFRIWIDMNNNGSFEDTGELLATSGVGTAVTLSITIPAATITGSHRIRIRNTYTPSNAVATMLSCTNGNTYGVTIDFTLNVTGGTSGVSYSWSPSTFLGGTSGASVNASGITSPITYTATATATNGCAATGTASIAVNPLPVGSASPQTICSGATSNVPLSSTISGSTFSWAATVLSGSVTGLTACSSTCGTSIAQTLTNTSNSIDGVVRYTVTPLSPLGCAGTPFTVDVTVNPKPLGTASNATMCSGLSTSIVLNSTITGTTFAWSGANFTGTTTGFGSGSGSPIVNTLTNTSNTTASVVRYTITPTSALGCVGTNFLSDITVNPTPFGATSGDEVLCSGDITSGGLSTGTSGSSTFTWTANGSTGNVSGYSNCSSACGNTISQQLTNSGSVDETVTYSIIPTSAAGCVGSSFALTETVGAATVASASNVTIYSGSAANVAISSTIASTDFTWTQTVSGSVTGNNDCQGGCGTSITDVLTNTGTTDAIVEYTISSVSPSGCPGLDIIVDVTVKALPTITCPATATITSDAGICTSSASIGTPSVTGTSTTISHSPSGPYALGSTTVIWTVTDGGGNTATCSQTVIVTDTQVPTIIAPAQVNTTTNAGCTATGVTLGTPSTADNCTVASVSSNAPTVFPLGSTTVIWTVTDGSGNTATASQIVIVTDNISPTITAPADVTVCNGQTVVLGTPATADNCSVASVSNNHPSGTYAAGTTVVVWTVTDGSGNIATANQNVTVNVGPVGSASNIVICNGDPSNLILSSTISGSIFTWTSTVTTGTVFGNGSCPSNCATTISDVLTNIGTVHGVVEYTITPTSPAGCVGSNFIVDVTVGAAPATPVISGPAVVCQMNTATYSVVPVPEATTYTWTVPTGVTGMTITSGQGTPTITVSISAGTVTGNITCTASNNCLPSNAAASMAVTKKPATPGAISGPTSTCGQTTATYFIASVFGASSYAWIVPAGMTITTGQGTTQITVSITSTFVSGLVKVSAVNPCGSVAAVNLQIYGNVPPTPVSISGPTAVCGITSATYSVPAVAGATGYQWTISAATGTIQGSSTGTSVTVILNGTTAGTISCSATNVCGAGTAKVLNLITTAAQPGLITGPTILCNLANGCYSVPQVAGYTYTWSVQSGLGNILSGQGTNSICISYNLNFSNGASSVIAVTASNTCGISIPRNLTVSQTAPTVTPAGPTNVTNMTTATYHISPAVNAVDYIWTTTSTGGQIKIFNHTTGQFVTPPYTTTGSNGAFDTTITVQFTGTGLCTSCTGAIKVAAQYSCLDRATNTSTYKTLPISGVALNPNAMNPIDAGRMFSEIYPNPSSTEFMIDITSNYNEEMIVEVFDVLGNKVIEQKRSVIAGESSLKTNVETLETGMYFVRILDANNNVFYTQRLVKQ